MDLLKFHRGLRSCNQAMDKCGQLPENKYAADAVVLNDKAYVVAGRPHQECGLQQSIRGRFECIGEWGV